MSKDNIVLVTGASSGIGAAIARKLANDGHNICINYRSNSKHANELKDELCDIGIKAIAVKSDISTEAGVSCLFKSIDHFGELTALINNAGVISPLGTIESTSLRQLETLFKVNVFGSFLCSKEAVKRMSTKNNGDGGNIINISSIASRLGSPNEFIDYASTKGAIDTFTIGLAKEVADAGIRVNAVRPGLIDTEMHTHCGDSNRANRLKSNIPMLRVGKPEEVANIVSWLISDEASYITGTFVDVAGGR